MAIPSHPAPLYKDSMLNGWNPDGWQPMPVENNGAARLSKVLGSFMMGEVSDRYGRRPTTGR